MAPDSSTNPTQLLSAIRAGDDAALRALLGLLYEDLRAQALRYFRHEAPGHVLQPTALVHEALVRMVSAQDIPWESQSHFLAVAAKAMRNVLCDYARAQNAKKRSGLWKRVTLSGVGSDGGERFIGAVDLEDALGALEKLNPRQAAIVELRFYAGLSVEQVAHVLEVSPRTVELDWRMARAWLREQLGAEGSTL